MHQDYGMHIMTIVQAFLTIGKLEDGLNQTLSNMQEISQFVEQEWTKISIEQFNFIFNPLKHH